MEQLTRRRSMASHPAASRVVEALKSAIIPLYGAEFADEYVPFILSLPEPPIRTLTSFCNTRVARDFGLEAASRLLSDARKVLARARLL